MKRFGKVAWAAGWFALAAAGHACAAGMGGMDNNPVHAWQAVSEDKLDDMRGGFDVPSLAGLRISFGIDRAVFINGDLVASASVNIPDVARMTTTQAQQLASVVNTVNIVQNGPNNVAPPDVATGGVSGSHGHPEQPEQPDAAGGDDHQCGGQQLAAVPSDESLQRAARRVGQRRHHAALS